MYCGICLINTVAIHGEGDAKCASEEKSLTASNLMGGGTHRNPLGLQVRLLPDPLVVLDQVEVMVGHAIVVADQKVPEIQLQKH